MSENAAQSSSMTSNADAAEMAPQCPGCHRTTEPSSSTDDGVAETMSALSRMGAPSTASAAPRSQAAQPALDDDGLEQAWCDLGELREYEPPSKRELEYLADSRRRKDGTVMQRQRLQRNNKKYRRHSAAHAATLDAPADADPSEVAAASAVVALAFSSASPADADPGADAAAPAPSAPDAAPEDASRQAAPAEGGWARLVGLTAKPTLNGTLVRIGPWHDDRQRFEVRGGRASYFVQPRNLCGVSAEEAATADQYVAATEAVIAAEAQVQAAPILISLHRPRPLTLCSLAHCPPLHPWRQAAAARAAGAVQDVAAEAARAVEAERDYAVQKAETAMYRMHSIELPISPLGFFNTRDDLLEYHNFEAPPDQASRHEYWSIHIHNGRKSAAWVPAHEPFCCVGRRRLPTYAEQRPHNVDACPGQPQWALCHLVEWTFEARTHKRQSLVETWQCAACANTLLHRGCPLQIVSWAELQAQSRV